VIRAAATLAVAVVLTGCSPSVDSFSIHRFSVLAGKEFPPLDRTVKDMDMGCHLIDLGAGDRRTFDDSFEAELLGAIGMYTRGNDLWPTPIPRP
jgi:hypothetical protein